MNQRRAPAVLAGGETVAAIAKVRDAIDALRRAQADGLPSAR
jgi:hypothetical protein